jgi:hypothetical protein
MEPLVMMDWMDRNVIVLLAGMGLYVNLVSCYFFN